MRKTDINKVKLIANNLQSQLDSEYVVALKPDHPYLFAAPDILIGGRGHLTAIFSPKSYDRNSFQDIQARLILAKLALPKNTRYVAAIDSEIYPKFFQSNFNEVLFPNDLKSFEAFIRDPSAGKHLKSIPNYIYQVHNLRFETIQQLVLLRSNSRKYGKNPKSLLLNDSKPPSSKLFFENISQIDRDIINTRFTEVDYPIVKRPKNVLIRNNWKIAFDDIKERKGFLQRIRHLCRYILLNEYELDSGIPLPVNSLSSNILLTDIIPFGRIDPLKAIRSAAFAGWATITAESEDEIHSFRNRLSEVFNERINNIRREF